MDVLISFDEDTGISVDDFAGAWNTEMSHEGVAEIRKSGDTFNADWIVYLGAAASAIKVAEWTGMPSLKDIVKRLFPKRAREVDTLIIEEHVSVETKYMRVRKSVHKDSGT